MCLMLNFCKNEKYCFKRDFLIILIFNLHKKTEIRSITDSIHLMNNEKATFMKILNLIFNDKFPKYDFLI